MKEQTLQLTAADKDSNQGMFVIGEKDITQSKRKPLFMSEEKYASTIQRLNTKLHNNTY